MSPLLFNISGSLIRLPPQSPRLELKDLEVGEPLPRGVEGLLNITVRKHTRGVPPSLYRVSLNPPPRPHRTGSLSSLRVHLFLWECVFGLRLFWCRRESVAAQKQVVQLQGLRRSRRNFPASASLGSIKDRLQMEGADDSGDTKTSDEYSPGDQVP